MGKLIFIRCIVLFLLIKLTCVTDSRSCKLQKDTPGDCICYNKQATCNNLQDVPVLPDKIETLSANSNEIRELTSTSFSHPNYKQISLGSNKIYSIDKKAFYNLIKLKVLDLSNNNLKFLDENTFKNNLQLKVLHLHGNFELNFSLHYLPRSLEMLDLWNTSSVSDLTTLKNLQSLHIYKGYLSLDDIGNATIIKLKGSLCTHTTESPNVVNTKENEETVVTNCSQYEPVSTPVDTNNMAISDSLGKLEMNIQDIAVRVLKLENVVNDFVMKFGKNDGDFHSKIDDDIHKIQIYYNDIITKLNKVTELNKGEDKASSSIATSLVITMFIIIIIFQVIQGVIILRHFHKR